MLTLNKLFLFESGVDFRPIKAQDDRTFYIDDRNSRLPGLSLRFFGDSFVTLNVFIGIFNA